MDFNRICINCMRERTQDASVCEFCGFDAGTYQVPPHILQPFSILKGRYLIGKMLGAGGFGITYLAYDLVLEYPRAIKEFFVRNFMYRNTAQSPQVAVTVTSPEEQHVCMRSAQRFQGEARTLARLGNLSGIVKVQDLFEENGTYYYVMEYLPGQTLKQYIKSKGRLSWEEATGILAPVMRSLQKLHERGIIHRDISPDNMIFNEEGELCLLDFGGAKVITGEDARKSTVIQTKKGYSPVEQFLSDDKQGAWTDVYAMAATLYDCLCGKPPVDAYERVTGAPLKAPGEYGASLSTAQWQALQGGLEVSPSSRYQSMEIFLEALGLSGISGQSASPVSGVSSSGEYRSAVVRRADGTPGNMEAAPKTVDPIVVPMPSPTSTPSVISHVSGTSSSGEYRSAVVRRADGTPGNMAAAPKTVDPIVVPMPSPISTPSVISHVSGTSSSGEYRSAVVRKADGTPGNVEYTKVYLSSDGKIICPRCGTVQRAERKLCFSCGVWFELLKAEAEVAPRQEAPQKPASSGEYRSAIVKKADGSVP